MVQFPIFVPECARNHARHFLSYYESSLISCESRIAEANKIIDYYSDQKIDVAEITIIELRKKIAKERKHKNELADDISRIKRLVEDPRMEEVYSKLDNAFSGSDDKERKIDLFIKAAWASNQNFAKVRDGISNAKELSKEIEHTAKKLAGLLRKVGDTGILWSYSQIWCMDHQAASC